VGFFYIVAEVFMPNKKTIKTLNRKQVNIILKEGNLTLDLELTKRFYDDVYSISDGRLVVVYENGQGLEYCSRKDFMDVLMTKEANRGREGTVHMPSKQVARTLQEPNWTYQRKFPDLPDGSPIYTNIDGRSLLVTPDGNGLLYLAGNRPPVDGETINILEGCFTKITKKADFINSINSMIDALALLLKIPRDKLDGSIESLSYIDTFLYKKGKRKGLEPEIFELLIVYFGEVLRVATNSRWVVHDDNEHKNPGFIPVVATPSGDEIPPHAILFDGLYESGTFYLEIAAKTAIWQPRVIKGDL
jgi:hypothetical protein